MSPNRFIVMRLCVIVALTLTATFAKAWDDSRLAVPLMVNQRIVPYPEFAVYLMPGETLDISLIDATGGGSVRYRDEEYPIGSAKLQTGPDPGLTVAEITNTASGETARLNVFTMVPARRVGSDGRLNGYRIGAYPAKPLNDLAIYRAPNGFVEVTAENAGTRVSPNFRLGQFVSKQVSDYPKYLVLRASLLLKLENILATLNRSGHATEGFVIMSGYRTPFYNRAIGNTTYSRHQWGGAADFYIDVAPQDDRMDDLNGDGQVNRQDARWLADFISGMSARGEFGERIGGLGVYGSTTVHGPFVHVDVRGTRARW